jgi:hypothetical protein
LKNKKFPILNISRNNPRVCLEKCLEIKNSGVGERVRVKKIFGHCPLVVLELQTRGI